MKRTILLLAVGVLGFTAAHARKPLDIPITQVAEPVVFVEIYTMGFVVEVGGAPIPQSGPGSGLAASLIYGFQANDAIGFARRTADAFWPYYRRDTLFASFSDVLRRRLSGVAPFKEDVRVKLVPWGKFPVDMKNREDAVLGFTAFLTFSADLRSLQVGVSPELYFKRIPGAKAKTVFEGAITYQSDPLPAVLDSLVAEREARSLAAQEKYPRPLKERARKQLATELANIDADFAQRSLDWRIAQWTANDGELIRTTLHTAFDNVARLLAVDIHDPATGWSSNDIPIETSPGRHVYRFKEGGRLISTPTDYVWPTAAVGERTGRWKEGRPPKQ
jgi:hypothetical protein